MKHKAIIVDLDGTLCDSSHRLHHIVNPEGKVDWPSWDAAAHLDPANKWCVELVHAMHVSGTRIIFLTGRGLRLLDKTSAWIHDNLPFIGTAHLFMRGETDRRPDTVVKAEIYKKHIEPLYDVLFAIDDRNSVVKMWRDLGLTCLHCAMWTEDMEKAADVCLKPNTEPKEKD